MNIREYAAECLSGPEFEQPDTNDMLSEAFHRVMNRVDCYGETVRDAVEAVYPDYGGPDFRTLLLNYATN